MVLRTVVPAPEAEVEIADFMPWQGRGRTQAGRVVRLLRARRGPVTVRLEVVGEPGGGRPGRVAPFSTGVGFGGLVVRTGFPVDGRVGEVRLDAGERRVVTVDPAAADLAPLSVGEALELERRTADAWRRHVGAAGYEGPYAGAVERSLLALLALTVDETGALVRAAAGPERGRAWLRDGATASEVLEAVGLEEDADTAREWLWRVLVSVDPPLPHVYDAEGDPAVREDEAGLRLDAYADVVDALHVERGARRWDVLARVADWLSDGWREPDRGPWNLRAPRQLVASKLACWHALRRLAAHGAARNPLDLAAAGWRLTAAEVLAWVEANGVAGDGGLRGEPAPEEPADASLLLVGTRAPWPPELGREGRTVRRTLSRLGSGPFVHEHEWRDARPEEEEERAAGGTAEAPSLACSFWAVEALARAGRMDEAHERMERLVAVPGPLGLLPSRVEPSGSFAGVAPDAPAHVALVRAAIALAAAAR